MAIAALVLSSLDPVEGRIAGPVAVLPFRMRAVFHASVLPTVPAWQDRRRCGPDTRLTGLSGRNEPRVRTSATLVPFSAENGTKADGCRWGIG